jgi:hypothetical protein
MRALNHAVTGALIGLSVGQPLVAVPAALASHFVLDVIPHYDNKNTPSKKLVSRAFKLGLVVDAFLCGVLVAVLYGRQPYHWALAAVCAFVAASPDLLSFPRFLKANQGKSYKLKGYFRWAQEIQWFERPIGAAVEIAWLVAGIVLLLPFLR